MVHIIPAKHQHVSIVICSMLMLKFESKRRYAYVQPQRATSVAVTLCLVNANSKVVTPDHMPWS